MNNRVDVAPIISAEPYLGCNIVALSDVGCVREENQDFMGYARLPDAQVLIVADGMGGHSGGFEASRIVVSAVKQAFAQAADQPPPEALEQSLRHAHELVRQAAASDSNLDGMGSTAVIAYVQGRRLWLAHVGDSRAYLIRDGLCRQLTADHTRVNRMVEEGMISAEEAEDHPMGHILERSLGAVAEVLPEVQPTPHDLLPGDRVLLCSDGFTGRVKNHEIAGLFSSAGLEADARAALQLALDRQADDNTTLALIEVDGPRRETAPILSDDTGRRPRRDLLYGLVVAVLILVILLLSGALLYGFRAELGEMIGLSSAAEPEEPAPELDPPPAEPEEAPMLGPDNVPTPPTPATPEPEPEPAAAPDPPDEAAPGRRLPERLRPKNGLGGGPEGTDPLDASSEPAPEPEPTPEPEPAPAPTPEPAAGGDVVTTDGK